MIKTVYGCSENLLLFSLIPLLNHLESVIIGVPLFKTLSLGCSSVLNPNHVTYTLDLPYPLKASKQGVKGANKKYRTKWDTRVSEHFIYLLLFFRIIRVLYMKTVIRLIKTSNFRVTKHLYIKCPYRMPKIQIFIISPRVWMVISRRAYLKYKTLMTLIFQMIVLGISKLMVTHEATPKSPSHALDVLSLINWLTPSSSLSVEDFILSIKLDGLCCILLKAMWSLLILYVSGFDYIACELVQHSFV